MNQMTKSRGQIYGVLAIIVLIISTVLFFVPMLLIGLLKLIPITGWQRWCTKQIDFIITGWCAANNAYIRTMPVSWTITGMDTLRSDDWYLVIANHQSWLDIVVLQRLFNRNIPVLKFFIKDQLKWIPLLGFCWWAMGCPFMKRYSSEYLLKNPSKKGTDLEATRKALEIFKQTPSSIMNFVEGTRFTPAKKMSQKTPYQHLLMPRAGGISFVISAMSGSIRHLLDVTIVYSDKKHSLWDFLCHRIDAIIVDVREIAIPAEFQNDSLINDETIKEQFRTWLNAQWQEKDDLISKLSSNH